MNSEPLSFIFGLVNSRQRRMLHLLRVETSPSKAVLTQQVKELQGYVDWLLPLFLLRMLQRITSQWNSGDEARMRLCPLPSTLSHPPTYSHLFTTSTKTAMNSHQGLPEHTAQAPNCSTAQSTCTMPAHSHPVHKCLLTLTEFKHIAYT